MINALGTEFKKPRVKIALIVLFALAVVSEVILPFYDWRSQRLGEISALLKLASPEDELTEAIDFFQQQSNEIKNQVMAAQGSLPRHDTGLALRAQQRVNALAETYGLDISVTNFVDEENQNVHIISSRISVAGKGSPEQILSMLSAIETGEKPMNILRFTLFDIKRNRAQFRLVIEQLSYV